MKFTIEAVRPAPAGFKEQCIGLVTFVYYPDQFAGPLGITRASKNNKGEWKEWPVATIIGAGAVKIIDAQLNQSAKGPWLSTGSVSVPDDVRRDVAAAAFKIYNNEPAPAEDERDDIAADFDRVTGEVKPQPKSGAASPQKASAA